MPPRLPVVLVIALASCGPSVVLEEDDAATTGAGGTTTSTAMPPTDSTTGPTTPPSPPGPPADDGGDPGSSGAVGDASTKGGGDEGCMFLGCDFDMGSWFQCDVFAQDCPPGEKCMPWAADGGAAWNATRCSPVAESPTQVGEPCMVEGSGVSGIDDCDVGLMCWNVDESGNGVCEDMCTGSLDAPICEDPEDYCAIASDGVIALCVVACHPLLQDCPIENEGCWPVGQEWGCFPDGGEQGAVGDPCEYANACDPGNVCVVAAAFTTCDAVWACCSTLCDLEDENADAMCQALDPAQTCQPWYAEGQAPVGYGNVGVCMIAGAAP
jgi:hypothetical protein